MAVGHWANIAEAEKLTQSVLVAGLVDENIKNGGILPLMPVVQFAGQSATWNRESTIPTAQTAAIGATLTWVDAAEVDQQDTPLKIVYVQTPLNHFVEAVYGSINNYQAIQLMQNKKAMLQKLEDLMLYGDLTFSPGNLEFDGLHALAQASATDFNTNTLDIDQAEGALSLANLRLIEDNMRHGLDAWIFPKTIARRLDAYVQEVGISTNTFGSISFTLDDVGKKVTHWNGTPILRSDYSVAEQADTGAGSDARAKRTSGTNMYSIFAVKFGQVMNGDPGLTFAWGNTGSPGELWKTIFFPNLEDFDSSGLRLVTYGSILDGSSMALARIRDITDVAVVA